MEVSDLIVIGKDPRFAGMRGDRRFQKLMQPAGTLK